MKRLVWIALAVAFVFCGCGRRGEKEPSQEVFGALRVSVAKARVADVIKTVRYSGIIKGYREVPVAPGMSSWVTKILVREGEKVRRGQVLVKLSPEQFRQAEAQYKAAKENYERMKRLFEQGSISQQQFDQVEAAYKAARAAYELAAKNTELRAPFDGIVASVDVQEGEFFNAMMAFGGTPSVVTVVDVSKVKLEVNVSERDVVRIKPGQMALLHVEAYPDTTFVGEVERVDQVADPKSGTYKVTIVVPNDGGKLRSGMYAVARIVVERADSVLAIPEDAIVEDTLAFVAEGAYAKARRVVLGVQGDSLVEIKEGISPGDRVIVTGTLGLFDGAPIVVRNDGQ